MGYYGRQQNRKRSEATEAEEAGFFEEIFIMNIIASNLEPGEFEDLDVECKRCGVTLICPGEEEGCVTTKEEAAAFWNRRSGEK